MPTISDEDVAFNKAEALKMPGRLRRQIAGGPLHTGLARRDRACHSRTRASDPRGRRRARTHLPAGVATVDCGEDSGFGPGAGEADDEESESPVCVRCGEFPVCVRCAAWRQFDPAVQEVLDCFGRRRCEPFRRRNLDLLDNIGGGRPARGQWNFIRPLRLSRLALWFDWRRCAPPIDQSVEPSPRCCRVCGASANRSLF